jgi:hypothetical protein
LFIKKDKRIQKIKTQYFQFDLVEAIPETLFEMFITFYEKGDLDIVNWDSDEYHIHAKKEMDVIYRFAKFYYPKFNKKYLTDRFYKYINSALIRMIKIRAGLWT